MRIYALESDGIDMRARLVSTIDEHLRCTLLVVMAENIMLCQERKLQLLDYSGARVREWVLDTHIRSVLSSVFFFGGGGWVGVVVVPCRAITQINGTRGV